jgi:Ser/Thr protein kinase RdoA (MazF antagonist)
LRHLRTVGFYAAPEVLKNDNDHENEKLSFIKGDVYNYPLPAVATSLETLLSAAKLLRAYHDATTSFLSQDIKGLIWLFPAREPQEVICHGDYAPYNVVLNGKSAIGIIDFDTAHPGPRIWDIAYALYRWAPLKNPQNRDGFGTIRQQARRAKRFCDAYGISRDERITIVDLLLVRLQALLDFMLSEAASGNKTFQTNIADGHHLLYQQDMEYINSYNATITKFLTE